MSPDRAYEILLMEARVPPESIPEYTSELVSQAWEFRAKQLIAAGTWPRFFTAEDWARGKGEGGDE